jgi:crotonobetainyl-CoA:carnitine CoA-transferase CaiB-like acyl-CoA transferase
MSQDSKPLADVTAVSVSQVISGPVAEMFLADLGADVIKIESPDGGEPFRRADHDVNGEGANVAFETYNRNKRSLALDLKSDEALEVIYRLVESADLFLQNFSPGTAERLSLGYDDLKEYNEELVYVSIRGYRSGSSLSNEPAFDAIMQHISGFSSLHPFDEKPISAQIWLSDFFSAYNAALSGLAALYHRKNGGGGQKCEISMFHSLVHNMNAAYEKYRNLGVDPGEDDEVDRLFGAERTGDGWISIACVPTYPHNWEGFCKVLGEEELMDHPEYRNPSDRNDPEVHNELNDMMREWLGSRTTEEALEKLKEHEVPAAPYNTVPEAAEMDHVEEAGTFVSLDHPRLGALELVDTPLDLSVTEPSIDTHAPQLGEHSEEILDEIGYSDDEIGDLIERGIVSGEV